MKKALLALISFSIFGFGYAQGVSPEAAIGSLSDDQGQKTASNANIDMQVVYGQYNNVFSTINLAQEQSDFVYMLSSSFKRSNKYGYKDEIFDNSSYFENKIGFTGNLNVTQKWKSILDVAVYSDSHGMLSNPDFSREERERIDVSFKNIHKATHKLEVYYAFGGANFSHQLLAGQQEDSVSTKLTRYSGEFGWEYIWSASNRFRGKGSYVRYHYTSGRDDYDFASGEIIDDFFISSNLALNTGLNFVWYRDFGVLGVEDLTGKDYSSSADIPATPIAGFAVKGLKSFGANFEYRYDLHPFKPDDYYFSQKYIYPAYGVEPARVHNLDGRIDIRGGDAFTVKITGNMQKSDNYINYHPISFSGSSAANVLSASTVKALIVKYGGELFVPVVKDRLEFRSSYTRTDIRCDENITYTPKNAFNLSVKYLGDLFNAAWENRYLGVVYVRPDSERHLERVIIGSLDMQYKASRNLFANLRIENLYNSKYYLREGYPESGLTALFGLRILI